jgi:hypothetical protein
LLGKMFEESGDMAMKSLICSHLLTLFVQSSLPDQRVVFLQGENLLKRISTYYSQFLQVLLDYWTLNDLKESLLHSSGGFVETINDQDGVPICDIWDGRLLCALDQYCLSFGHQILYSALPDTFQRIIRDHFPPAVRYFVLGRPLPEIPPNELMIQHFAFPPLIQVLDFLAFVFLISSFSSADSTDEFLSNISRKFTKSCTHRALLACNSNSRSTLFDPLSTHPSFSQ